MASAPDRWAAPKSGLGAVPAAPAPDARGLSLDARSRAVVMRNLATLAQVMPVAEAVAALARQPGRAKAKAVLAVTHRALQAGQPLGQALPARAFPADIRATVAAGESAGRLPAVLNRLADGLESDQALRGRLLAALAYPALLLAVAVGVVAAMLVWVVPAIAEQLADSGEELPSLTRAVLALSDFTRDWGWLVLLAGLLAAGGVMLARRRPEGRAAVDRAWLRLPVVGPWLAALESIRFARLLGTMAGAGLPLAEALMLVVPTLRNAAWADATRRIAAEVRAGRSLSQSIGLLPRAPDILPALVSSGEAAGRLAPLLDSAAATLDRELADRTRAALALVEPAIILILGGAVGLIILSVLLPILQLNQLAGARM